MRRLTNKLINLKTCNEYLIKQRGRCIMCKRKFDHCGGTVEVHIPCEICLKERGGLVCMECVDDLHLQHLN